MKNWKTTLKNFAFFLFSIALTGFCVYTAVHALQTGVISICFRKYTCRFHEHIFLESQSPWAFYATEIFYWLAAALFAFGIVLFFSRVFMKKPFLDEFFQKRRVIARAKRRLKRRKKRKQEIQSGKL
jgi:hypothetical protein